MKKILTYSLIFICFSSLKAQDYMANIEYWSIEDGLSDRNVYTVFKGKDGLLWLTTRNGLNSFNGYEFRHWLGKQQGVDLTNITRIGQDDEGWLWLQRQDDLIFFNPGTEEFQTIIERFGADCILNDFSASHYTTHNFLTDKDNRLYYLKHPENVLYTYHSKEGIRKANASEVAFFYKIRLKKEFIYNKSGKDNDGLYSKDIDSRQIWKTTPDNQIKIYDNNGKELLQFSYGDDKKIEEKYINRIIVTKENRGWICTRFGLYRVDINKKLFHYIPNPKTEEKGQLAARGIAVSENAMTVALEPGIGQYNFNTKTWSVNASESKTIYQINENEYWLGSFKYLIHYKDGNEVSYRMPDNIDGITFNTIWSIVPSRENPSLFWLGTKKGLMSFNTISKAFKKFTQTNELQQDSFCLIQDIIPDKKIATQYWLCSSKGLFLMDENAGYLAKYTDETEGEFFLPATNFHHLYQDKANIYWLSTNKGLIRWDKETGDYKHFTQKDGLANDVIYAVYEDDFKNLWMSSDFGIISIDKETSNVHNYLPNSGIGQKEFNRISHLQTNNGKIYFGGLNGITSFYPKDFQVQNAENLPKLILSKYQAYNGKQRATHDKTLEIKQANRIVLRPSDYIIDLQFSVLSYNNVNKNIYSYQLSKNGKPYTDWQTQKKRSIQLGQLPYGKYKLTVKGKNAFNTACENEIVLDIVILRPFYLTWWFMLIMAGVLFGIGYVYTAWRTKTLQIQQENLKHEILKATEKIRTDKQTIEAQAEDLRKLDELKTRFFANVSHELRTPLTLMLGPIKSVLKRNNVDNKTYTFLSTAERNGQQLLKLINEILDLNKLEAGKIELNEETIAFYPFIKRLASNFTSYAENAKIQFAFDYQLERDIHLLLDTKKFETIINNLLANAFKFTPKHGSITIQIKNRMDKIQIGVIDTGRGIHPEDLPNIFNRFYQTKQKGAAEGGTGIGLALCKEFAELLGGSIRAESELSNGSQFYLEIPRKEVLKTLSDEDSLEVQEEFKTLTPLTPSNYTVSQNGEIQPREALPTILVVEDNPSLRDYLKLILEDYYEVVLTNNGKEALDWLKIDKNSLNCQLILSDIMMPIMDGYQLLETLKGKDDWRHIPIVMLTARADKEDKLNALRIGVDDYVLKPFDEDELLARISNLLANSKSRQLDSLSKKSDTKGKIEKTVKYTAQDSAWLKELEITVLANVSTTNFTTETLAQEMSISRRQLNRKIKEYTGLTPNKYITEVRLQKARTLLEENGDLTVKEVSYKVGFLKTAYFSKLFIERFGKRPSEVLV